MKRFKALKITFIVFLAILIFGSGFVLGLDFTYKFNIRIPAISEIVPKISTTVDSNTLNQALEQILSQILILQEKL